MKWLETVSLILLTTFDLALDSLDFQTHSKPLLLLGNQNEHYLSDLYSPVLLFHVITIEKPLVQPRWGPFPQTPGLIP